MLAALVVEAERPARRTSGFGFEPSDADLVGGLIGNRPEAQRLAVQRFSPLVRAILRRSLGHPNDIDDAQQEVFLCLFRRIHTLREPRALRGFITGIALRTILQERRRRRTFALITLDPEIDTVGVLTRRDEAVASYALIRLGKLILRLRERERKTFVLRFVQGMTASEIAKVLAISEATTRRSFTRAWHFVKMWAEQDAFLSDYFGDDQLMPQLGVSD